MHYLKLRNVFGITSKAICQSWIPGSLTLWSRDIIVTSARVHHGSGFCVPTHRSANTNIFGRLFHALAFLSLSRFPSFFPFYTFLNCSFGIFSSFSFHFFLLSSFPSLLSTISFFLSFHFCIFSLLLTVGTRSFAWSVVRFSRQSGQETVMDRAVFTHGQIP
jgi:hypothetical protein